MPELRIVPQELWDAAKKRQKSLQKLTGKPWKCLRPRYLLSGLIKCGVCGGGYSKISSKHYGCSVSRNKGESVCTNRKTIRRETLERTILTALTVPLTDESLIRPFSEEYTQRMNELRHAAISAHNVYKLEKERLTKERKNILEAIRSGISISLIKDELERVTGRLGELDDQVACESENTRPKSSLILAERYRGVVATLDEYLSREDTCAESAEHLGGLIDKIVVTPVEEHEDLQIGLYGELADILASVNTKDRQNVIWQ